MLPSRSSKCPGTACFCHSSPMVLEFLSNFTIGKPMVQYKYNRFNVNSINGIQCDIWKHHASGQAKLKGMCTFTYIHTHMAKHVWRCNITNISILVLQTFIARFHRWVLCLRSVGTYAQHVQGLQRLGQQLWGIKGTPRSTCSSLAGLDDVAKISWIQFGQTFQPYWANLQTILSSSNLRYKSSSPYNL